MDVATHLAGHGEDHDRRDRADGVLARLTVWCVGCVDEALVFRTGAAPEQLLPEGAPQSALIRQAFRERPAEVGQQVTAEQIEAGRTRSPYTAAEATAVL
jgi:hypothetical protein